MKKTMIFGLFLVFIMILVGCAEQEIRTYSPPQKQVQEKPEPSCSVKEVGDTQYYCSDAIGGVTAWKGKICDSSTEEIITEQVACVDNHCIKEITIIKNCKDYGANWICGYRSGGQQAHDTVCTKPDWSEIIDI